MDWLNCFSEIKSIWDVSDQYVFRIKLSRLGVVENQDIAWKYLLFDVVNTSAGLNYNTLLNFST